MTNTWTDYFIASLSMPLTAKQVYGEVTRLKLLGPNGNSPGIFIVDETPFQEEQAAAAAVDPKSTYITGRILPSSDIYKEGAYRLSMKFSDRYPFKPPEVSFTTPIYHLNVDKDGLVCLPILRASEAWNPNTSLADVVKAIVDVIDNPKIEYAMSPENTFEGGSSYDLKLLEKPAESIIME